MMEAKQQPHENYFEHFEADLIREFERVYGEKPLFNKNAGRNHRVKHNHKLGWKLPLQNVKANYKWAISSAKSREQSPKLE